MKDFRKKDKKFICEECNALYNSKTTLGLHIRKYHNEKKYYDKWLKKEGEGVCKNCGKKTKFTNKLSKGYKICCSKKCASIINCSSRKITWKEKYGAEHPFKNPEIYNKVKKTKKERYNNEGYTNRKKAKETNLERYGYEYASNNENIRKKIENTTKNTYKKNPKIIKKRKKTCIELYGNENYNNREKQKETCVKLYGNENYNNGEKRRKTNILRYGVENSMQNEKSFEKMLISSRVIKKFKNTDIYYQASYELDFLEKYYDMFLDIKRGPTIKYMSKNINRRYYPDFFIPSLNLIIEIKSLYLANKDKKQIEAKEKATIANGFNYIMIVNKNYSTFDSLVLSSMLNSPKS